MSDDGDTTGRGGPNDAHRGAVLTRGSDGSRRSLDEIFELLASHRRRIVLSYLAGSSRDVVPVAELVEAVTAWEAEFDDVTVERQVSLSLQHVHLPKLASAGLVEVDEAAATVSYLESDRLEAFLDLAAEEGFLP